MTKSTEDAVQIPGRRPELGLVIEALAEHPIAMPVFVFDAVIVARPRRLPSASPAAVGGGRVRGKVVSTE
jgi:hypothetical protein